MQRLYIALVALASLGALSSCAKSDPNDGGDPNEPQNIREVSNLLRSAGKLPEPPAPKLELTKGPQTRVGSASRHLQEYSSSLVNCDKFLAEESYDYVGRLDELALLDSWSSGLWPGSLLQGSSIRGNAPKTIPLVGKRQPGTILLQTASRASSRLTGEHKEGSWSKTIEVMDERSVQGAQDELVRQWRERGVPASTSYSLEAVHSMEEVAIATGLDLNQALGKIRTSFATDFSVDKGYVLVKLYQRFYTLSYQDPEGFKGFFRDNIQRSDLEPYTGSGNPICYVSSVSYGRVYYMLFESSYPSHVLLTALNSTISDMITSGRAQRSVIISGSKAYLLQRGDEGVAQEGAVNPNKLSDFVLKGAVPSASEVGVPLSVTIKHLYDASPVRLSQAMKYSSKKSQFIASQKVNTLNILLRSIRVSAEPSKGWHVSNESYVVLEEASLRYLKKEDPNSPYIGTRLYPVWNQSPIAALGLRGAAHLNVYGAGSKVCGFAAYTSYDQVRLHIRLKVRPEAYRQGESGASGERSGEREQTVSFTSEIEYDSQTGWSSFHHKRQDYTSVPFRSISFERQLDDLRLTIDVNYSIYMDNLLLSATPKR